MKNHQHPNLQSLRDNGAQGDERAALNRAKAVMRWVQCASRSPVTIGFASDLKTSEPAPGATGTGSIQTSPPATNKEGQKHNGKTK